MSAELNYKEINSRIKNYMFEHGVTQADIIRETEIPSGSFSECLRFDETGKKWTLENLMKIKEYFDVPYDELLQGKKSLSYLIKDDISFTPPFKIYGNVAAGKSTELGEEFLYTMKIEHPALSNVRGELTGFLIKGDSMMPRFRNGDIAISRKLIVPNELPRDKDFIITVFKSDTGNSDANIKLFTWQPKSKKDFILTSLNAYHQPIFSSIDKVRYFYKVYLAISPIDYK